MTIMLMIASSLEVRLREALPAAAALLFRPHPRVISCVQFKSFHLMKVMPSTPTVSAATTTCISTSTLNKPSLLFDHPSFLLEKSKADFITNKKQDMERHSRTYEDAIRTLNELQSNAEVIKMIAATRDSLKHTNLPETIKYLARSGVSLDQVDSLNTIHISGTKGKGSTCAFIESILRHAGLKTGFFSSPHLVSPRGRIRINGKPISAEQFTHYFFQTYDGIERNKEHDKDFPPYFRFLYCMAFHVFLEEKIDVAVIEVGIGGTYDCTNILRKPVVVGITSLGLDHQPILGNTVEEIAEQKAGIMKLNVPAITVSNHQASVENVLKNHAKSVNCPIYYAAPLSSDIKLGIENPDVSQLNAGLAIQIANTFLHRKFPEKLSLNGNMFEIGNQYPLQSWHVDGLKNCRWPGRYQVVKRNENLTFYLDGAHTLESFAATLTWFSRVTSSPNSISVLVFHLTGFRQADNLLEPFIKSDLFDKVIFCPIVASVTKSQSSDNWSKVESDMADSLREKCQSHADTWKSLQEKLNVSTKRSHRHIFDTIEDVISFADVISKESEMQNKSTNILVTGSLHLVGSFLSLLDPSICD